MRGRLRGAKWPQFFAGSSERRFARILRSCFTSAPASNANFRSCLGNSSYVARLLFSVTRLWQPSARKWGELIWNDLLCPSLSIAESAVSLHSDAAQSDRSPGADNRG